MLPEIESVLDKHIDRKNFARNYLDLVVEAATPFHSAQEWSRMTARQFASADMNEMNAEKVIENIAVEWVSSIVMASKEDGVLQFCSYYWKPDVVTVWLSHHFHDIYKTFWQPKGGGTFLET